MKTVKNRMGKRVMALVICFFMLLSNMYPLRMQVAFATGSDVILSSGVYIIDNTANTITGVPYSDRELGTFMGNLIIPAGASVKVYYDGENDSKNELISGSIVSGDEVVVTSEDGTASKTYIVQIDGQYNAEVQFSHIQGYNNWYYKEYVNGQLQEMHWDSSGRWNTWVGSDPYSIIWKDMMHPDTNSQPARIFKAPKNGILAVDCSIRKMVEQSNGVRFKILKNGQVVWPTVGDWETLTSSEQRNLHIDNLSVQKADELAFVLENNGDSGADTTYWLVVLTYMPEIKIVSSIEIQGDSSILIPVSGSAAYSFKGIVKDQNDEAITGEAVSWSIDPAVNGVAVGQDGVVAVESYTTEKSICLKAVSITNPQVTASRSVILAPAGEKIYIDDESKLLVMNSGNMSMLVDYNNKAKIMSLKVNGVETLDAEGIVASVAVPGSAVSIGTSVLANSPDVTANADTVSINNIYYSDASLNVNETWVFTVNNGEDINWHIERTYGLLSGINTSLEQKTAGFTFKKDVFDTAYRSDGGSQVLLSPVNRAKILAFDPYDKQYGTTEAAVAYEGGGVDLVNVPAGFVLSLACTSQDRNIVSEFYRDPYSFALKFDNKLNSQPFAHNLYRPEYDLGFHCFIPAYGQHSYDPVTVLNGQVDMQDYSIKAYTTMDIYYDIGNLPQSSGIDEYKLARFMTEFGRTSIVDLNGMGGSWNALRLEFADTMAGQFAINIMNGMQFTDKNSVVLRSLKALVEAGLATQRDNGHIVGCPEISGQAYNYEYVSEADAAVPMDAAAYINATRDVEWAYQVKDGVRKALDYRLSKDANNNGLVENETDNNYGRINQAWLDMLYTGGEDAYVNALMYAALTEWADIEQNVIGDVQKAQYYRTKAQNLKETYNKDLQDGGLWSDSYQGFIGWRFLDGSVKADVKYLHVNAAAIAYGVAENERARDFLFGGFDGYANLEDWMIKNNAKAYPLNLQNLDKTEIVERFLNEWPGWENGQVFPQTTGDMMAAYARMGSTLPIKYMKNLIDFYFQQGEPMYHEDTFTWDFGTNTYNCNTRMAINMYAAASLITGIFGFKPRFEGLEVNPVLDESLYGSEINYNMRGHHYKVRFDNNMTRTMLENDGVEKVIFKWNNLVPGEAYSVQDEDITDSTQSTTAINADENGIVSYEIVDAGQHRITISGPAAQTVISEGIYKATAGFSDIQNGNNWSYYELASGNMIPLQWNEESRQWENAEKSIVITCRTMKAGNGKQASRTFKVPQNGVLEISGSIRLKDVAASGSMVRILKNGNEWWPSSGSYSIDSMLGTGFKGIMNVLQDDLVQFVVEGEDTVIWSPKVAYIDNYNGNDTFEILPMPQYIPVKDKYSAEESFAFVQGIDNWYYEEYYNGTGTPMHWSSDFTAWQGSAAYALIGADWMHPDIGVNPARVFEAPRNGYVEITGAVTRNSADSDGVKVCIMKNGTTIWPEAGQWKLLENTAPVEIYEVLEVSAGDKLYFVVNCNVTSANDTTSWAPVITYIPYVPVTGVSLDKTSISMAKGTTCQLTAEIQPYDATNKSVTWTSSNEAVATVDQNGLVTALKAGDATITVKTVDGGYEACCSITVVKRPVRVKKVI